VSTALPPRHVQAFGATAGRSASAASATSAARAACIGSIVP
jgi:hypothetical protein